MLFLSYWCVLIFIFHRFTNIQATTWDLKVCFKYQHSSINIAINNMSYNALTSSSLQTCFSTKYELSKQEKPSNITVYDYKHIYNYEAFFHNGELQEMYVVEYNVNNNNLFRDLEKWVHWSLTVLCSEINNDDNPYVTIDHYGEIKYKFRRNSRTSKTSFFLPMEMNEKLRIKLSTYGKFWLDTIVKLKNVDTSKIYSCIYVYKHKTYHECSLRNDTGEWKIELSSYLNMSKSNMEEEKISVGVTGSGKNYSQELTFQKLAYLPTLCAYINIGTRSIDDIEIYFKDNNRYFDILKIVMTHTLTGEEIGCANIQQTYPSKYSCKLLKSNNWLLKIISPEEHEVNFYAEIIQDSFSSLSKNQSWNHFSIYGDSYIKYFNLKTYEDEEITAIKFHYLHKSLRINEISMIRNHSEYKLKTSKESNSDNYFQREFTKEDSNQTSSNCLTMRIVLGILAAITLFVIIICIILIVRCKMPRYNNNKNKGKVSIEEVTPTFTMTHQVLDEDNYTHYATPDIDSTQISEPKLLSKQNNLYDILALKSNLPLSDVNDIESLYAQPQKKTAPEPIDNPDIEQLYAQICK